MKKSEAKPDPKAEAPVEKRRRKKPIKWEYVVEVRGPVVRGGWLPELVD